MQQFYFIFQDLLVTDVLFIMSCRYIESGQRVEKFLLFCSINRRF